MKTQRFNDFYEAYSFLKEHEICKCRPYLPHENRFSELKGNYFYNCLDIDVVKVNPETNVMETEKDKTHLNTKTQVWLEFGEAFVDLDDSDNVQFNHDHRLDCGADTFEEAIIELANLVDKYYHDNGEEKQGAKYEDLKINFRQYLSKQDKDLLLTETTIYNIYDQFIDRITSIIRLSTGECLHNDLEYDYEWKLLIEG